jgi:DNA modification methylase
MRDYDHPDQLGHEETLAEYVAAVGQVFDEVWRVLRDDGTAWLNLADRFVDGHLVNVAWSVVDELERRDWMRRSHVIWNKVDSMPEPMKGWCYEETEASANCRGHKLRRNAWRPTKAHEHLFLLTKSMRYYADGEDVREKPAGYERKGGQASYLANGTTTHGVGSSTLHQMNPNGANRRSVWNIGTARYKGDHDAPFPVELARICLAAGTSRGGCCPKCRSPFARVGGSDEFWPTCGHWQYQKSPVACRVLDPMAGSGSALVAARELGLDAIGTDLNFKYVKQEQAERLGLNALMRFNQTSAKHGSFAAVTEQLFGLPLFVGQAAKRGNE